MVDPAGLSLLIQTPRFPVHISTFLMGSAMLKWSLYRVLHFLEIVALSLFTELFVFSKIRSSLETGRHSVHHKESASIQTSVFQLTRLTLTDLKAANASSWKLFFSFLKSPILND